MVDSIIFDLDGTLWDSTKEVAAAFRKVVKDKYPYVTDEVTAEKLKGLFGQLLDDIAVKLFLSVQDREEAVKIIHDCCDYEVDYLKEHGAKLYDGVEETLKVLAEKYKLFIVSNCQEGYIQCFFDVHPYLEQYFLDYEYPGRSGLEKADNIRLVIERNQLQHPIYVGDTKGDRKAARKAQVPFVFARYGFGEVEDYDYVIDSFSQLAHMIK